MGGSRPARFMLLCGLLSAALHALVFAARPAQEVKLAPPQPRHSGGMLLVAPRNEVETPSAGSPDSDASVSSSAQRALAAEQPPPAEPVPAALSDSPGEGDYVPRPLLSVAPQPQQAVMLTWPDFDGEKPQYQAILALYIDEQGVVQRIRTVEGDLPQELDAQARAAFFGVRFAPGQLDGVAVRSRIQVEVVFERPEPPPSAARGLRR